MIWSFTDKTEWCVSESWMRNRVKACLALREIPFIFWLLARFLFLFTLSTAHYSLVWPSFIWLLWDAAGALRTCLQYISYSRYRILLATGPETRIWRSTRSPVHSGSRGGTGCSRAPGHRGEEAGRDHSPGPSSFLAPCRPPAPAALKTRPLLITYHQHWVHSFYILYFYLNKIIFS